ncbi:MAG: rfbN [Polaromonas sp.]|nr:rfbN [Polaromonas sp.]
MNQRPPAFVPPKVSVLIRTTGRGSLIKAIESVHLQNCGSLELLVLNASTNPLPSLPGAVAGVTCRVIEAGKVLDRASAAQVLIETASAPYGIFLDDDDWWLAGHLAKLTQALDADESLVAAYADVQCLTDIGYPTERTDHIFQREFDRTALQLSNYLPIHSVLFRMQHVRMAPVSFFDPALKLFEDWDFWLQLSQKGSFARVPGVSAVYALNTSQGSGHTNAAGSQRTAMLALLSERQLRRWRGADVVELMSFQGTQANLINHLSQLSALNASRADELEKTVELLKLRSNDLAAIAKLGEERCSDLELIAKLMRERAEKLVENSTIREQELGHVKQELTLVNQRADALDATATHAGQKVAELESVLAVNSQALDKVRQYSALQQAEIDKLSELRRIHLAQIEGLYRSTSWRVTYPLRLASRTISALTQRSSIGLVRNVANAAKVAVRRHGVRGFVSRLPYYLRRRRTYVDLLRSPVARGHFDAFVAPTPELRDIRLHPDLTGGGETIDAKISVVIPTLNAGPEFALMLRKLRSQKSIKQIEIVVVDSGSRDATVRMALDADAKVVEITPAEFTHSYARNLGADHATGDYILFMVQDAYPIGSHWMYGMLRFLLDHADRKLVAVSCSEYSRSDSDMMYDSMINTHYRFLGCLEFDRIGEFSGDDHMSLRSRGQLSDVSCLISRDRFQEFRYRGNYAEDLDLGIRLIKSGMKVGMLASVKVIHSHNRPAFYYLKRSYVDVIFLVGLFDDFVVPPCQSLPGLLAGILSTAGHISGWLRQLENQSATSSLGDQLLEWIVAARTEFVTLNTGLPVELGDTRLNEFVASMSGRFLDMAVPSLNTAEDHDEARRFGDSFIARLDHFRLFANEVYGGQDDLLRTELGEVVRKTFAAAAGSALAFYYLDHTAAHETGSAPARRIHDELAAGV